MRKGILIVVFCGVILCGCGNNQNDTVTISQEEYDKLTQQAAEAEILNNTATDDLSTEDQEDVENTESDKFDGQTVESGRLIIKIPSEFGSESSNSNAQYRYFYPGIDGAMLMVETDENISFQSKYPDSTFRSIKNSCLDTYDELLISDIKDYDLTPLVARKYKCTYLRDGVKKTACWTFVLDMDRGICSSVVYEQPDDPAYEEYLELCDWIVDNLSTTESAAETGSGVSENTHEATEKVLDKYLNGLREKTDDFSGTVMYCSNLDDDFVDILPSGKARDKIRNPFQIYCNRKGSEYAFYVSMVYYGNTWIFFDKAQIKAGDTIYDIDLSKYDADRDTFNSDVMEVYRPTLDGNPDLVEAIRAIIFTKKGSIRYTGDKAFTYELKPENISAITEMMKKYDSIKQETNN